MQRRAVGEGNDLDVSAAELDLAEIRRDRRLASVELQESTLELNRLIGLPPSYEVRLSDSGKPLSVTIFDDPSDETLQERLLAGRLDLRAKEAEYRVAEEELRLAVARQYPRLKLGPSYEHEGSSDNFIGVAAMIELPIFDRNQGGIAAGNAARDRLRAEYTALLHRLRAQAFAARARVRAARAEVETQEREVLPLLDRNQHLFRGAFEARELSVLDWITSQQRALRTRRAYLDSLAAYRLALLDLDAATGLSMSRAPGPVEDDGGSADATERRPGRMPGQPEGQDSFPPRRLNREGRMPERLTKTTNGATKGKNLELVTEPARSIPCPQP
jgi:outer membrane protein TolC